MIIFVFIAVNLQLVLMDWLGGFSKITGTLTVTSFNIADFNEDLSQRPEKLRASHNRTIKLAPFQQTSFNESHASNRNLKF